MLVILIDRSRHHLDSSSDLWVGPLADDMNRELPIVEEDASVTDLAYAHKVARHFRGVVIDERKPMKPLKVERVY